MEARRAHNPEVVGSSPTSGIRHATDVKQSNTFTGVAQRLARRAHNPEVIRSKRITGIFQFVCFQKHSVIAK